MTGQVQRGTGVRAYPSAVRIRKLGRPKKTKKWVFHHSRVSREAETLGPPEGYGVPPYPPDQPPWPNHRRNLPRPIGDCMNVYTPPIPPYRLAAYLTRRPNRPPRNPIMPPWPCDRTRPGDR